MRGELDNAEIFLDRLWAEHKEQDKFGIELQILRLKMHILVKKPHLSFADCQYGIKAIFFRYSKAT